MTKFKDLLHELKHHLPFTFTATVIGVAIVLLIQFILKATISEPAFEILHPLHVVVSALVSAGIFYKYKKNIPYAIFVGIISAILIGSISDIIFPYLGAAAFGFQPKFHLPILEKPFLILGAALVGSIAGIKFQTTKIPHAIHIFLSVFASLFYLMAFTQNLSIFALLISIMIVTIAVIVPCCVSDILLPFFFLGKKIKSCDCNHGHCHN